MINFSISLSLSNKISLIFPAKWTSGGRGLDEFRKFILEQKDICNLTIWENAKEIFPSANISGGINIVTWQKNWNNKCKYTWVKNKTNIFECDRELNNEKYEIFIRNANAMKILEKIGAKNLPIFSSIVSARKPYGFCADIFNDKTNKYNVHDFKNEIDYKIFGVFGNKGGAKRIEKYISKWHIKTDIMENKDNYKLFFSKAFTFKPPYSSMPKIIVAKPFEICSETFLSIGKFETLEENNNCLSFIKTKLWRYLFSVYWSGMNVSKKNFNLIPLIDFKKEWDDKKIYEYFGFSNDEINEIETNVGKFNDTNYDAIEVLHDNGE